MSLAHFDTWLTEHLPEAADSLHPHADDDGLARVEDELGVRLPADFIALYHWHDGQSRGCPTGIFYGMRFMSLQEVLIEWRFWAEEANGSGSITPTATDVVKQQAANRHWIPFAEDGGGNFLAIDLDPGPSGLRGQVINFGSDEDRHFVLAANVRQLIAWMVSELQAGNHCIEEDGDAHSFNILRPKSAHFLDAARTLFDNAKPRRAARAKFDFGDDDSRRFT